MFQRILRRVSLPASLALVSLTSIHASLSSPSVCQVPSDHKMSYRMLGNTGLQTSVLSYGFWATFGAKSDLKDVDGIAAAKDCLRTAREYGVNLFDNAESKYDTLHTSIASMHTHHKCSILV